MAQVPATFWAQGDLIDYTPGAAVTAGDVVVVNGMPLVAFADIAAGVLGALRVRGVIKVPKITGAFAVGDSVYWNPTGSPNTGTASSGAATGVTSAAYFMGYATVAAASGDDFVYVNLGVRPPTAGRGAVNADVAATGSVQGDAAAVAEGFTVVTGADATKGVILPTAVPGATVELKNGAAAVLKVWPATGAAINAGSANASFSVPASTPVILKAKTATQWYSIPLLPS